MYIFFKANIAAIIASLFDYAVTIALVYFLNADPVWASVSGAVSGGIINFLTGHYWAFGATQTDTSKQAYRYAIVWTGSLVLNACGMYLLTKQFFMQYVIAKSILALIVAFAWNYPLQKNYVFRKN